MRRSIVNYNGYGVEIVYSGQGKTLRVLHGYYLDTGLGLEVFELQDIERREKVYEND